MLCKFPIPGIFFICLISSLASSNNSLSFISPDLIFSSSFEPTFLTKPNSFVGFLIRFLNTSLTEPAFSLLIFKSAAVSSAISRASFPSFPFIIFVTCSCISVGLGKSSKLICSLVSLFSVSSPFSEVLSSPNKSCICEIVSSIFVLNSSSFMASNSFALSPKVSPSEILDTIVKSTSCKYFQIVSRVLSLIFSFHKALNLIPGKNSQSSFSNSEVFW